MRAMPLLLASLVGLAGLVGCQSAPPEMTVVMTDYAFEPKQLNVQPGQKTTLVLETGAARNTTW